MDKGRLKRLFDAGRKMFIQSIDRYVERMVRVEWKDEGQKLLPLPLLHLFVFLNHHHNIIHNN